MNKFLLLFLASALPCFATVQDWLSYNPGSMGDTDVVLFERADRSAVYTVRAIDIAHYVYASQGLLPSSAIGTSIEGHTSTLDTLGALTLSGTPASSTYLSGTGAWIALGPLATATISGTPASNTYLNYNGSAYAWLPVTSGVSTFNGRAGAVTLTAADITGLSGLILPASQISGLSSLTLPASQISGLATVATSGAYGDLTGTPTIPAALTLTTSGTSGAATLSGGVLNIPIITGTTYYAGANETLNSGTFTTTTGTTSITVAVGNDTRFPASVSGIRLGNGAGSGDVALTVGSGLTLSGTTLSVTGGTALTNPMTMAGDIIYGGTSGTPTRLQAWGYITPAFLSQTSGNAPVWYNLFNTTGTYTAPQVISVPGASGLTITSSDSTDGVGNLLYVLRPGLVPGQNVVIGVGKDSTGTGDAVTMSAQYLSGTSTLFGSFGVNGSSYGVIVLPSGRSGIFSLSPAPYDDGSSGFNVTTGPIRETGLTSGAVLKANSSHQIVPAVLNTDYDGPLVVQTGTLTSGSGTLTLPSGTTNPWVQDTASTPSGSTSVTVSGTTATVHGTGSDSFKLFYIPGH